ncbi:hypothetical protein D3C78_1467030 [compost metagenome]
MHLDRFYQTRVVVLRASDRLVHAVPLEHLGRLALLQDHQLGALLWRGWVQPFLGEGRGEHHRPTVVQIDHAALAVRSDDHEAVVLAGVMVTRVLADAGAEARLPVPPTDEVGLLLRTALI